MGAPEPLAGWLAHRELRLLDEQQKDVYRYLVQVVAPTSVPRVSGLEAEPQGAPQAPLCE